MTKPRIYVETTIPDDGAFLGLIRKWLKAGILESDGAVVHSESGTPQGGIVSPVLANVYLHYVLDLWFAKVVKVHCRGEALLCRYADDWVCAFRFGDDAERFYRVPADQDMDQGPPASAGTGVLCWPESPAAGALQLLWRTR